MGNIHVTVTESQSVTKVTEWSCHNNSHMSWSQHVTKKSADRHEDCGRQGA